MLQVFKKCTCAEQSLRPVANHSCQTLSLPLPPSVGLQHRQSGSTISLL